MPHLQVKAVRTATPAVHFYIAIRRSGPESQHDAYLGGVA